MKLEPYLKLGGVAGLVHLWLPPNYSFISFFLTTIIRYPFNLIHCTCNHLLQK
ncbi:hypothetical protein HanRHA438_Chr13g0609511 [Helianthus annuus]|nr:hypothetical protein HanRHA438_Chr13g0609511 [Helianthus annuus]